MVYHAWLTILLSLLTAAVKSTNWATFYDPPKHPDTIDDAKNPIYRLGDKLTIKYTTAYQNYNIKLWQEWPDHKGANPGPVVFEATDGSLTQFDWAVQAYQFNIARSPMFYFQISPEGDDKVGDNGENRPSPISHYFNITEDTTTSVSSSSIPSTPTMSSISRISTPSPSQTSAVAAPTPTGRPNSSVLGTGAQAGIGIGAALAGLSLAFIAFIVYRRKGRQPRNPKPEGPIVHPSRPSYQQGPHEAEVAGIYKPPDWIAEAEHPPPRGTFWNPVELSTGQQGR